MSNAHAPRVSAISAEHEELAPASGMRMIAVLSAKADPKGADEERALYDDHVLPPAPDAVNASCVVCARAAFGLQCPCCHGDLCTEHDFVLHRWCDRCERAYGDRRGLLDHALVALAVLTSALAVTVVGLAHLRDDPFLKGFSAAALLAWVLVTVSAVLVRGYGRARFRAAPSRL